MAYCAAAMRRWAVLGILTYLQYVPVPALRPPSLAPARDGPMHRDGLTNEFVVR